MELYLLGKWSIPEDTLTKKYSVEIDVEDIFYFSAKINFAIK
jgi:hypothetical protein